MVADAVALCLAGAARAQLPGGLGDAGQGEDLRKEKVDRHLPGVSGGLGLQAADWEYKGVKYRGSKADAKEKFLKDPDKYVKAAEKERFVNNFMITMSPIWCPVTDEVTPGGMTQWNKLGYNWESCCAFCDDSVTDEDFPEAIKKLEAGGKIVRADRRQIHRRGQESVEGAIKKPAAAKK